MNSLESLIIEGDNPVTKRKVRSSEFPSRAGHEKSCLNLGGPSSKAKYYLPTDSELVPRGKGEKKAQYACEKNLKPYAYKAVEGLWLACQSRLTACLLHNEPAS